MGLYIGITSYGTTHVGSHHMGLYIGITSYGTTHCGITSYGTIHWDQFYIYLFPTKTSRDDAPRSNWMLDVGYVLHHQSIHLATFDSPSYATVSDKMLL